MDSKEEAGSGEVFDDLDDTQDFNIDEAELTGPMSKTAH